MYMYPFRRNYKKGSCNRNEQAFEKQFKTVHGSADKINRSTYTWRRQLLLLLFF